jgi:hypothetical protein
VRVSDNEIVADAEDECYGLFYDGDVDNTRTIELKNDGNLIETYRQSDNGDWIADDPTAGESTFIQIDKYLEAETTYNYTVQSYNDDGQTGAFGDESSVDGTTGNRPTVTVLTPNGAEIRSINDLYDVDFATAGNCAGTVENCQDYIAQIEVFYNPDNFLQYLHSYLQWQNPHYRDHQ